MNASVRKVALVVALIFVALFANLNVVQLGRSRALTEHPLNRRGTLEERGIKRGQILAADGTVLAESVATKDPIEKYRRVYPLKDLMGPITGYSTSNDFCSSSGIERSFNDYLTGQKPVTSETFLDELLGRERAGNILKLTIRPDLQRLARKQLGRQRGAVAAIDPRTGAILALWSNPSYDPNLITRQIKEGCIDPKRKLENDPSKPLRSRATLERFPPGSTFKIITAAAGLASGMRPTTSFPDPRVLNLPDTERNLANYQGGSCRGGGGISMATALNVSCNTTFAQIAMRIGPKKFDAMARRFGLGEEPDFDVPAVPSCLVANPGFGCLPAEISRPATAYSGIGQQDVRLTPLQMARVVATVANLGRVPRPYLVQKVLDPDNKTLRTTKPQLSKPIYTARVARQLREMLYNVVRSGTGAVVGFSRSYGSIGGKTGTAQTGVEGAAPHVWFVAFSSKVAVAVVVENGGYLGRRASGGRVAGPIAKAILEKVLRDAAKD